MALASGSGHQPDYQRCVTGRVDHRQPVCAILNLPALRRRQCQPQRCMVKIAAPCEALLGAVAIGQTRHHFEVTGAALVVVIALVLRRQLRDGLQALVIGGVRRQPVALLGSRAAFGGSQVGGKALLVFQHRDHVNHVAGVVVGARQIFRTQPVGLQLLVAAIGCDVARRHVLRHPPRQLTGPRYAVGFCHHTQDAGRKHTQPRRLLTGGALRTVAGGDVANLMPHDTGQIGLAFHVGHDAARHIHIAAGQRKGIDLGAVQHREMPLQLLAVRLRRQTLAQVVDIGLHRLAAVSAVLLQHPLVRLGPFGDFGLLGHHRALTLARDRIHRGGAAGGE